MTDNGRRGNVFWKSPKLGALGVKELWLADEGLCKIRWTLTRRHRRSFEDYRSTFKCDCLQPPSFDHQSRTSWPAPKRLQIGGSLAEDRSGCSRRDMGWSKYLSGTPAGGPSSSLRKWPTATVWKN